MKIPPLSVKATAARLRLPYNPPSRPPLDLLMSALLSVTVFPVLLYFGVGFSIAIPLCVLAGLTSQQFLRLIMSPKIGRASCRERV